MRILLAGGGGTMAARVRNRLRESTEIVQMGGAFCPGVALAEGAPWDTAAVRAAADGAELLFGDLLGLATGESATLEASIDALLGAARAVGARRVLLLGAPRAAAAVSGTPLEALRRAEDRALREGADRVVVLSPAALLAPGLVTGALGARMVALLRGEPVATRSDRLRLADARDVGAAVEAALRRGVAGQRYALGSRSFRLDRFDGAVLRHAARLRPLPWTLPSLAPDAGDPLLGAPGDLPALGPAVAALGWWTRRPGLTLRDTVAALAVVAASDAPMG